MKRFFSNSIHCRVCGKELPIDKVKDHCHSTGKYRGSAHQKSNINVTQEQSNFILFINHNYSNYDCHMFFEKLVIENKDKVEVKILPKTNEEYISVRYGYIRIFDSFKFLSLGLDKLVETLVKKSQKSFSIFKNDLVGDDFIC